MSGLTVARGLAGLGLMVGVSGMVSSATQGVMKGDGPTPGTFNTGLTGASLLALTLLAPGGGAGLGSALLRNAGIGAAIGLGAGLLLGAIHHDSATGAGELQPPTPGVDAGSTSGGATPDDGGVWYPGGSQTGPPTSPGDSPSSKEGPSDLPPNPPYYPDGSPGDYGGTILDGNGDFPVEGGPTEAPPDAPYTPDGGDNHVPVDPPPVNGEPWHPGGWDNDPGWNIDPGFYVDPPPSWNGDPGFTIDPPSNWNGDPGFTVNLPDAFAAAGARRHPGASDA